jgi:hypothetical protein
LHLYSNEEAFKHFLNFLKEIFELNSWRNFFFKKDAEGQTVLHKLARKRNSKFNQLIENAKIILNNSDYMKLLLKIKDHQNMSVNDLRKLRK